VRGGRARRPGSGVVRGAAATEDGGAGAIDRAPPVVVLPPSTSMSHCAGGAAIQLRPAAAQWITRASQLFPFLISPWRISPAGFSTINDPHPRVHVTPIHVELLYRRPRCCKTQNSRLTFGIKRPRPDAFSTLATPLSARVECV
jgi:hypothetical protein